MAIITNLNPFAHLAFSCFSVIQNEFKALLITEHSLMMGLG
jgi:hypothetical protein